MYQCNLIHFNFQSSKGAQRVLDNASAVTLEQMSSI